VIYMNVTLSVFMALPEGGKIRNKALQIGEGSTVADVVDLFHISDEWVWLYVVNHHQVLQRHDALKEGDHLMVFPPMEGG